MKRLSVFPVLVVALAVFAASCSKNDNSVAPADNTHFQYIATLLPANEAPTPILTGSEAAGSGLATIDFTLTRDSAGAITGGTANFRVDVKGFPATTAITAAHIHPGAAGVAGGVLLSAVVAPGEVVLTNGAVTFSRLNIAMTAVIAQQITNNPPGFYFNVHSVANPGGVMRGQLVQQ